MHCRQLRASFGWFLVLLIVSLWPEATALGAEAAGDGEVAAFDWRAFLAPFHTVTLHLPIGFVTIAVILEIYWFLRPSVPLRRALALILWVSGLSAVVVTMLGFFRASGGGYEAAMLEHHERYGVAVAAVTMVLALIHQIAFSGERTRQGLAASYRILLLVDVVLLTIAGHGGGNLTHGSKYLVEGAPEWARKWLEEREASVSAPTTGEVASTGEYEAIIRPIFEAKCFSCHGAEKQKGDYRMDTREGLFAAGESELEPILPGKPLESYLVELITLPESDDYAMPPEGKEHLTPEETLQVMRWIWNGAETGAP